MAMARPPTAYVHSRNYTSIYLYVEGVSCALVICLSIEYRILLLRWCMHVMAAVAVRNSAKWMCLCRFCLCLIFSRFPSTPQRFTLAAAGKSLPWRAMDRWSTGFCCHYALHCIPFVNRKWIQLILDIELIWLCWYLLCGTGSILNVIAHSFLLFAFRLAECRIVYVRVMGSGASKCER